MVGPMTYGSIYNAVTSVTEATIGVAISPHGFRYAAATTAAWKAGNMPYLASGILQHQDRRITDASYIRATSFEAAQQFGKMLRERIAVKVIVGLWACGERWMGTS